MRIALVSTERGPVPPIRGGALQTYIASVAPYIARKHEVTVIGAADPELPATEVRDGVRYVRLEARPEDEGSYWWDLLEYVSRETFDVISLFNRPLYVLPVHQACPEARLVLSLHNEMIRETKVPLDLTYTTLQVLSRIVTVSEYIARSVIARYPEAASKVRTLYSGVDVNRFAPRGSLRAKMLRRTMRKKAGVDDEPVIFTWGGFPGIKGRTCCWMRCPTCCGAGPGASWSSWGAGGSARTRRTLRAVAAGKGAQPGQTRHFHRLRPLRRNPRVLRDGGRVRLQFPVAGAFGPGALRSDGGVAAHRHHRPGREP